MSTGDKWSLIVSIGSTPFITRWDLVAATVGNTSPGQSQSKMFDVKKWV